MILAEFCEQLSKTKKQADKLYDTDNLYIVWALKLGDTKLENFAEAIDSDYYRWRKELRGPKKSECKFGGKGTLQGYGFSVDSADVDMFEKSALMPSMKYSYRFNTYNFNEIKEKEKQELIEVLSEENK